jgi:hypothetical protein
MVSDPFCLIWPSPYAVTPEVFSASEPDVHRHAIARSADNLFVTANGS